MEFKLNKDSLLKYLEKNTLDMSHMHRRMETSGDEARLIDFDENGKEIPAILNKSYIDGDGEIPTKHVCINTKDYPADYIYIKSHMVSSSNHTISNLAWELNLPVKNKIKYVRVHLANRLISISEEEPYEHNPNIGTDGFIPLQKNPRPSALEHPFPFETMSSRGEKGLRTWMVFLNGLKVPDHLIHVYGSQNGTELYIPRAYFKISNDFVNELCCIIRDHSYTGYRCSSHIIEEGNSILVDKKSNISNKEKLLVYKNGLLLSTSDYTIDDTSINNSYVVTFNAENNLGTYEIYIDDTFRENQNSFHLNEEKNLFVFCKQDEKILKEAPLFIANTDIYVNGYRISKRHLKQITHRHIQVSYDFYNMTPVKTNLIFSDKELLITPFNQYLDEWMKYEKWLDENDELEALTNNGKNLKSEIKFPKLDYKTMSFLGINRYKISPETPKMFNERVEAFLLENPSNIRILLEYFGVKEKRFIIDKNADENKMQGSIDEKITFTLDNNDMDGLSEDWKKKNIDTIVKDSRMVEMYADEKYITSNDLTYFSKWAADVVKFEERNLDKSINSNLIRMYDYKTLNDGDKYIRINTTKMETDGFVGTDSWFNVSRYVNLSKNTILGRYDIEDLVVFQSVNPIDDDFNSILQADIQCNRQFKVIENAPENYVFKNRIDPMESLLLQMKIPKGSKIQKNRVLYIVNTRRHQHKIFDFKNIKNDKNKTDRLYLNSIDEHGDLVPYPVGKYNPRVFINGSCAATDIDYSIITPETHKNVSFTMLLFKKEIPEDSIVEVFTTGIHNPQLCTRKIHGSNNYAEVKVNKYGFIYFDNLEIPFSTKYMDLFVNSKKIKTENIIVYSDRLIRIKNEVVPFISVSLNTRFDRDYIFFKPWIEKYNEIKKEVPSFDEVVLKFCEGEFITEPTSGLQYPDNTDINDIYENAPDDIDNSGKVENPRRDDPNNPQPLPVWYDPLINRLAKDFNRFINKIPRVIDSDGGVLFSYAEYVALMTNQQITTKEIFLDCFPDELSLTEDWVLDCNELYRTKEEIMKLMGNMINNFDIDVVDSNVFVEDNYQSPLLEWFIYPSDIQAIDCNINLEDSETEDLIIDLNEIRNKE